MYIVPFMLQIHNTLTQKLEPFFPLKNNEVNMYVCGPTVYDHAHIGHGRVYVAFDAVLRYLRAKGYTVTYARNITDIDDKIIERANQAGVPFETHAQTYTQSFHQDMDTLGLTRPDIEPQATQTVDEIIAMIQTLIDKNFAYQANGDVYFRVRNHQNYGQLSKKNIEDLQAGARVAVSEQKEDVLDFALWKAAKSDEPSWDSPWGQGRPGWHIECSAMIKKHFADTIDIHAGGRDLIFPHHENEIAQSECANGHPFVRYWMHNGFVTMNEEKMSKSLGNTVNLKDLFKLVAPEGLKFYLLSSQYRSPIHFNDQDLKVSAQSLDKMYRSIHGLSDPEKIDAAQINQALHQRFCDAMDEDFNTAKAIGVLFDMLKAMNKAGLKQESLAEAYDLRKTLVQSAQSMGLLIQTPDAYFASIPGMQDIDVAQVEAFIAQRAQVRRDKQYDKADAIRQQLTDMGIVVEDSAEGTTWRKQS
jgi:cysteinyl-tRNA synthetase